MHKRSLLRWVASLVLLPVVMTLLTRRARTTGASASLPSRRVRSSDPEWPNGESWDRLNRDVGGRLIKVQSPLAACASARDAAACRALIGDLRNPYFIGDQPGATQTSGWIDAWMSTPSAYAVAARTTTDVVAAVNFAREHRLRLVVKGGGHSYQGTSNAADSLLIWTRAMNGIDLHDAFVGQGCAGTVAPQPAVTVEAGAIWMHVYDAVTTRAGRYVLFALAGSEGQIRSRRHVLRASRRGQRGVGCRWLLPVDRTLIETR
jgi:hypothetical protein